MPLRSSPVWRRLWVTRARRSGRAAFLAPPFTGLDTLPALGVVLLSVAWLMEDAALAIGGVVVAAVGVALEIALRAAIIDGVRGLF